MSEVEFRPLKIVFSLRYPVCLTYPWVHFDGILAHLVNRKLRGDEYYILPAKKVEKVMGSQQIPLKKTGMIYNGSVSVFDVNKIYITTIYKRFSLEFFNIEKVNIKQLDLSRGFFKNFAVSLTYIPARKATFYACGDPDEIGGLLTGLTGIGKKRSIGYGAIKEFKIKEIKKDCSIVKDGKAMRPIPVDMVEEAEEIIAMTYKPPYWAGSYVYPCVPPGAKVKLKGAYEN